jgi:hypothetical protein
VIIKEILLVFRGPASADDTNRIFVALGPYDKNEATRDGANCDEAILDVGVSVVEDLKVVDAVYKEFLGFLEETPCFRWFATSLASSHVTLTEIV